MFRAALEADPRLKAPYAGIGLICPELGNPDVGRSFSAGLAARIAVLTFSADRAACRANATPSISMTARDTSRM
ncbi:MAG: hypothetical protein DMG05_26180 [Acidobacteria bacterium]|nr:MAG: hypothetical protein DMG05_26180 [Acidobacteriota bacterium]